MRKRSRRHILHVALFSLFLVTGSATALFWIGAMYDALRPGGIGLHGKSLVEAPLLFVLAVWLLKAARDSWRKLRLLTAQT